MLARPIHQTIHAFFMKEFFDPLFESNFMPHGHCYYWQPDILWSHAISDGVIATAYFVIPLVLLYIFRRRSTTQYVWVMVLFAVFITGCGITHVFDVITIWKPLYRFDSVFRVITALASVGTALVLVKVTPRILAIPSAEQWRSVNEELRTQLDQLREKDRIIEAFREFESLTETLPQLVFTFRSNGAASFYNQQWYQYTGLAYEPLLDEALQRIIAPAQWPDYLIQRTEHLSTGRSFAMELTLRRYDGTYRWHLVTTSPAQLPHANWLWVCSLTDIDEQKQRHQVLEEKNRELSIINNDLDNFIYTASHDLRSPIANLEGLTSLLIKNREGHFNDQEKKIFDLMYVSIERFKGTLRDLTDIVRAQKEVDESRLAIPFQEILAEVLLDVAPLVQETDVQIETDFGVADISYARKNLKSIMYNLVSNALKYRSPARPLRLYIRTEAHDTHALLTVRDNGLGMTAAQQGKLFSMFRRFHTHVEGSGIGLYIVKRIVENAGGRIEVESQVGEGTTFRVYF